MEILTSTNTYFVVLVEEDSSFRSVMSAREEEVFAFCRHLIQAEFTDVCYPQRLPNGYCCIMNDSADMLGLGVNAIGTYLYNAPFVRPDNLFPIRGPLVIVRYEYDAFQNQRSFRYLTKNEARHLVAFLSKDVLSGVKKAFERMEREDKKRKFKVL